MPASRDLASQVDPTQTLDPQTLTANGIGDSVTLDRSRSATILFLAATVTDGTFTPVVQERDAEGDAWEDVSSDDLIGEDLADFDSDNDEQLQFVGYRGDKKMIRARLNEDGSTDGGEFGIVVIEGHLAHSPAYDMGLSDDEA